MSECRESADSKGSGDCVAHGWNIYKCEVNKLRSELEEARKDRDNWKAQVDQDNYYDQKENRKTMAKLRSELKEATGLAEKRKKAGGAK